MTMLMGDPDHYCSHEFSTLCTNPFLTALGYVQDDVEEIPIVVGDAGPAFVTMADDYICRPDALKDYSPVRFFEEFYKQKNPEGQSAKWEFSVEHPQFCTQHLVQRHADSKRLVEFSGIMPTSVDDSDPKRKDLRCMWIMAMLFPWRTIDDLLAGQESWTAALEARLSEMSEHDECMINNLEIRFRSKTMHIDGSLDMLREAMRDDQEVLCNEELYYGETPSPLWTDDDVAATRDVYADEPLVDGGGDFDDNPGPDPDPITLAATRIRHGWLRTPTAVDVASWKSHDNEMKAK